MKTIMSLAFVLAIAGAASAIESTFDADTEGWTATADAQAPVHHASGGATGGYVSALDMQLGDNWYWRAPTEFHGDLSEFYNKPLSFYLQQSHHDRQAYHVDVYLVGSGITLVYDTHPNPGLRVPNRKTVVIVSK